MAQRIGTQNRKGNLSRSSAIRATPHVVRHGHLNIGERMPYAGKKPCTFPGCGEVVKSGRCDYHRAQADRLRGTAKQRGYKSYGHQDFRKRVLARDPICVACRQAMATEADHYPTSRIDLAEQGLNPDDPRYGRGLCLTCHSRETAKHQPGGWNAAQ